MNNNLVFEKLSQPLAANQQLKIGIAGNLFRITTAQWPTSVSLLKNNQIVGTMAGMLAGDYVRDIDFDGVIVTNGSMAQQVTVQIAGGGAGSDRVLGEVSVVDGGKFRTLSNMAFLGIGAATGGAGAQATVQLFNPTTNTVNLYIESLLFSTPTAQQILIGINNAVIAGTISTAQSKQSGGVDSAVEIRANSVLVAAPAVAKTLLYTIVGANVAQVLNFREPIVIKPGYGCFLQTSVLATSLFSNFEFFEEPI